jgi:hypothetical protein
MVPPGFKGQATPTPVRMDDPACWNIHHARILPCPCYRLRVLNFLESLPHTHRLWLKPMLSSPEETEVMVGTLFNRKDI